jgi:hypothetical protein
MLFPGEFSNLQSAGSGMCLALVFRRELHWSLRPREVAMVVFFLFCVLVLLAFLGLTGPDSFVRRNSRR